MTGQVGSLLGAAVLLLVLGLGAWAYRCRLRPYTAIRHWADRMRGGDLSARLAVPRRGGFAELAKDINVLAEMVQTLSRTTEEQLQEFTDYAAMKERTRISGELHDSLAQTLASIKIQVRVLDETLHQGDEERVWQELEQVENSLEEANIELRELIAHFRAPVGEAGLVPSVERAVERFRRECPGVRVFLQNRWEELHLPLDHEVEIVRIVQEALANVRKHSHANTVRIMIDADAARGQGRVLVEDDGVGFAHAPVEDDTGAHVGLNLLRDRASRLGGSLRVESELGEGVRIALEFETMAQEVAA